MEEGDLEDGWVEEEEETRWEMKSLSSVDDAILAKQSQASLTSINDGYITRIGTDGNITQVGNLGHLINFSDLQLRFIANL